MTHLHFLSRFALGILAGLLSISPSIKPTIATTTALFEIPARGRQTCNSPAQNFLVMAGGGAPFYNEIALEKNVLYFQRSLQTMGIDPATASTYFANGNDGRATVRYLNEARQQRFKVPEIPHLLGASTLENFQSWLDQTVRSRDTHPIFFYFTGHGSHNRSNENNNAMILWGEQDFSVQKFSQLLDDLPATTPIVTVMSQCYSGSFANFIYESGNPDRPVALQTRCGFFATIKSRPSVGCTPEVNEADYRDYSSSFFAGLTGKSRTGQAVASADYNQDGRVSYAEAHAFAKVDEKTSDLPVSTLEVWLQERVERSELAEKPIATILATASPDRKYVVNALVEKFRLNPNRPWLTNLYGLPPYATDTEVEEAYVTRLGMELLNIAAERQVRESGDKEAIATLDKLLNCEGSSW
jgi:Peptidase C13 family